MSAAYRVSGLLPIFWRLPTFATPIFSGRNSNEIWMQDFNDRGIITEFRPVVQDRGLLSTGKLLVRTRQIGQSAIYAFCLSDSRSVVGLREDVADFLRQELSSFQIHSFITHQVATFIGDDALAAACRRGEDLLLSKVGSGSGAARAARLTITARFRQRFRKKGPSELYVAVRNNRTVPIHNIEISVRPLHGLLHFGESAQYPIRRILLLPAGSAQNEVFEAWPREEARGKSERIAVNATCWGAIDTPYAKQESMQLILDVDLKF